MTNTVDDTSAAESKVGVVAMTNTVDDTSAAESKVAENVVNTVSLQDRQDAFEAADRAAADRAAKWAADEAADRSAKWAADAAEARAEAGTGNKILDRYGSYSEYNKQLRMELMGDCDDWDNEGYYVGEGALKTQYNKCQP